MATTDVALRIKLLNPGNLDALRGPYANLAAANSAIPSVVVSGINYREGKFVEIGTAGVYKTYWWKGTYTDDELVQYLEDYISEEDLILEIGKNKLNKDGIIEGKIISLGGGGTLVNAALGAVSPIIPVSDYVGKYMVISGFTSWSQKYFRFLDANGDVLSISSTPEIGQLLQGDNKLIPTGAHGFQYMMKNSAGAGGNYDVYQAEIGETSVQPPSKYESYKQYYSSIRGTAIGSKYLLEGASYDGDFLTDNTVATVGYVKEYEPGNKFYYGVGSPFIGLGVNTDKYLDKTTGLFYEKINGHWDIGTYLGVQTEFTYPSLFTWHPSTIRRQDNGTASIDLTSIYSLMASDIERLTPYYVDSVNGSNSNSGLSKHVPLKSILTAKTLGARLIYLADGFYERADELTALTDSNSDPFIIMAENAGKVFMCSGESGSNFTWAYASGAYSTSRTNVQTVYDTKHIDSNGVYETYSRVSSLALCQSTPGSFFPNGATVYVHTLDNSVPDSTIKLGLSTLNSYTPTSNVPYVYIGGINFLSNNTSGALSIKQSGATQYNTKVIIENCEFNKCYLSNGLSIDNMKESYVINCKGFTNGRDNFNYHGTISTYVRPKVLELNCSGSEAGLYSPLESSCNGSTSHEGTEIIRINSSYHDCRGPVVIDVNDNARSLNINVTANKSILDSVPSGFQNSGTDNIMWLYGCKAFDTPVSIRSVPDAVIYKDSETTYDGSLDGDVIDI